MTFNYTLIWWTTWNKNNNYKNLNWIELFWIFLYVNVTWCISQATVCSVFTDNGFSQRINKVITIQTKGTKFSSCWILHQKEKRKKRFILWGTWMSVFNLIFWSVEPTKLLRVQVLMTKTHEAQNAAGRLFTCSAASGRPGEVSSLISSTAASKQSSQFGVRIFSMIFSVSCSFAFPIKMSFRTCSSSFKITL